MPKWLMLLGLSTALIVIAVLIAGDLVDAYRSGMLVPFLLGLLCLAGFIVAISFDARRRV